MIYINHEITLTLIIQYFFLYLYYILVSGTTIFKSNNGDIKKNIELLKSK